MKQLQVQKRKYIRWIEDLSIKDRPVVGGKNATLGDMKRKLKTEGIATPKGFATTSGAYWEVLRTNGMISKVSSLMNELKNGKAPLENIGASIRSLFLHAQLPEQLEKEITDTYKDLCLMTGKEDLEVAVRSSATAEDLPIASFAGMLESFLNVSGEERLIETCRHCYASLFTDRAISYGSRMGFDHMNIGLSIGIHQMVRSDLAGAGVMFSIEKRSKFSNLVVITAAWGLGENVVQGVIIPDEYRVFKPLLDKVDVIPIVNKFLGDKALRRVYDNESKTGTKNIETSAQERSSFVLEDEEILQIARWGCIIQEHYGRPMDVEWAKDGITGGLYVVQARPVTAGAAEPPKSLMFRKPKRDKEPLLTGVSIGEGIAVGKVSLIDSFDKINRLSESSILVSQSGNTTWVSQMQEKEVRGLVTDFGGRNSHGAIVCHELGIPGIHGTLKATRALKPDQEITISCVEGDYGFVYDGIVGYEAKEIHLADLPVTRTQIMINIVSETGALHWWPLPCDGIGLVRSDAILRHIIQVHPMALIHFDQIEDEIDEFEIKVLTRGYKDRTWYFIDTLSSCLAEIACSRYPQPVIVQMSDLNTQEYASLKGGRQFEPEQKNSGIELRGASRYLSNHYREAFALECQAIKRARKEMGLTNISIMIPHCRNLEEADGVLKALEEEGLVRGKEGLSLHLSCDHESNVNDAKALVTRFDGIAIAAQRICRMALAISKVPATNSPKDAKAFNDSLREILNLIVTCAHEAGLTVTVRGRNSRELQDLIGLLVELNVGAISVNPEAMPRVRRWVAEAELGRTS